MNRNRMLLIVVVVVALLVDALLWPRPAPPLAVASAPPAAANSVVIDAQQQAASGIQAQALAAAQFQPHTSAYASVLNSGALFQLRGQLQTTQAQVAAARAQANAAQREYQRLALLNRQDQTVSNKATEAAFASQQTARAQLVAAQASAAAARDSARAQWGAVLSGWAAQAQAPQFDALGNGTQALLLVAVDGRSAPPLIHLQTGGTARLLSAAPQADPLIQRATYFYLAAGSGLRSGMRVEAELPAGAVQSGVMIPNRAVVWYANQPWVYVQRSATQFVRRPLTDATPTADGWFVTGQVRERVVVQGAALLLSQALQPATPVGPAAGGDDDDD
jgi:multidrug efflux pump subunit AcrA (membrane-fusion protein)